MKGLIIPSDYDLNEITCLRVMQSANLGNKPKSQLEPSITDKLILSWLAIKDLDTQNSTRP